MTYKISKITDKVTDGNKLIAEFIGCKIDKNSYSDWWYEIKNGKFGYPQQLKYHSSWDWLMPIVEKIEALHDEHHGYFGIHICSNGCTIQATNFRSDKPMANPPHYFADWTLDTKINSTWLAVVEFIKWHNQNKRL